MLVITGVLAAYVLSYLPMTVQGRYQPQAYGLLQGPDDTAILAPKAAFGYHWMPSYLFPEERDHGTSPRILAYIYLPLIAMDQKLWHTRDKAESGRYRVKNYFDYDTMTYRDIEPK